MFIYLLTNETNGKKYVGQTIQVPEERFKQHVYCANDVTRRETLISRAIYKHGWAAFQTEIVEVCKGQEFLAEAERSWIRHYDCMVPNGYNMTSGGVRGGSLSDEVKLKMSAAKLGKKRTPFSEETKKRMSDANTGRVFAEDAYTSRIGRVVSREAREKIASAATGRRHSEETKRKISESKKKKS